MNKKRRFVSIRKLLIIYCVFMLVILLTVVMVSIQSLKKTEKTLVDNSMHQLTFVNNSLDTALTSVQFGVTSLLNNDVVHNMKYDVHSNRVVMNEMQKIIGASQSMGFSAIYWRENDYFVLSNSLGIDYERSFHEDVIDLQKTGWYKLAGPSLFYATYFPFTASKQSNEDYKILGIGRLRQDYIYKLLEANNSDKRIQNSLLFEDGQEISISGIPVEVTDKILSKGKSNESKISFKVKVDNKKYSVLALKNNRSKSWIVTTIDMSLLSKDLRQTIFITTMFIIIFGGIAISIVMIFYLRIYKNLNTLFEFFDYAERGDYSYQPISKTDADFGYIFEKYNNMLRKTDQLVRSLKLETKLRETAEYRQLQAQINPHFFYNNLLFIMSMADRSPNAVKLMTNHLAEYYRYVTKKNTQEVTLGQELNLAENYLSIIGLRKSLEFDIDCPEELLDEPFMQLIIQPIIENSVYHGIEKRVGSCEVNIKVSLLGATYKVTIYDDGIGLTNSELLLINKKISKVNPEKTDSVGLWNVNQRLINKYGEKSGLTFESHVEEVGYGLTVSFIVPFIQREEENR